MSTTPLLHGLLVPAERRARLHALPGAVLPRAAAQLTALAAPWVDVPPVTVDETAHNWHLTRARVLQVRVISLLVEYARTGEARFRAAALAYLRAMAAWEHWSWHAWRNGTSDAAPGILYDLTFGENAFTLAWAWDWLSDELTPTERAEILATAERRVFAPYLRANGDPANAAWYYQRPDSNWNTVCNGGAGTLALVLGDAYRDSARVLAVAEAGVTPYFARLGDDGAWPEGLGYWGYGHRYGFYFLLAASRGAGRRHPLLDRPGSRATLRFPLLFTPHGTAAGFGDVNVFFPLPFHLYAAEVLALPDVAAEVARRFAHLVDADPAALAASPWASAAELLLWYPDAPAEAACAWPRVDVLPSTGWGYVADCWPAPHLYAAVRGGNTDAPHTHQDLTSVQLVVDGERLAGNPVVDEYYDTTFDVQRYQLYEIGAASKSALFINGVGVPHPGCVPAEVVHGDGWEGVRLDVAGALAPGCQAHTATRTVLHLGGAALLIVDRVVLAHPGLVEARFHSEARVRRHTASAWLTGTRARLHLAFAANAPARLCESRGLPTNLTCPAESILRWGLTAFAEDVLLVTLCTPDARGRVRVTPTHIHVAVPGVHARLAYTREGLAGAS